MRRAKYRRSTEKLVLEPRELSVGSRVDLSPVSTNLYEFPSPRMLNTINTFVDFVRFGVHSLGIVQLTGTGDRIY